MQAGDDSDDATWNDDGDGNDPDPSESGDSEGGGSAGGTAPDDPIQSVAGYLPDGSPLSATSSAGNDDTGSTITSGVSNNSTAGSFTSGVSSSASNPLSGGLTAMGDGDDATWYDDVWNGFEQAVLWPFEALDPENWSSDGPSSGGLATSVTNAVETIGQGVAASVGSVLPTEGEVIAGTLALIIILFLIAYIVREVVA